MPAIRAIHFSLNGLLVTPLSYAAVYCALLANRITCRVGVSQDPHLPRGFVAQAGYVPNAFNSNRDPANQMQFQREDYGEQIDDEKCKIVHEATHASFDIFRVGQRTLAADDESAAFLASAIFSEVGETTMYAIMMGGPEEHAKALASKIVGSKRVQDYAGCPPCYFVSPQEAAGLRRAVSQRYGFVKNGTSDRTNE
jgi:hypothetical protein